MNVSGEGHIDKRCEQKSTTVLVDVILQPHIDQNRDGSLSPSDLALQFDRAGPFPPPSRRKDAAR